MMGIEFSYAAETAFVSPTLLKIGKYTYGYVSFIYGFRSGLEGPWIENNGNWKLLKQSSLLENHYLLGVLLNFETIYFTLNKFNPIVWKVSRVS